MSLTGTTFTLYEANRLLPLVRAVTRDAVRHYRAAKRTIAALEGLKAARREGWAGAAAALERSDRTIADHIHEFRRLLDEMESLGCHLRDYERGVVDFPAAGLGETGFVYYCWSLGEHRVEHWHADREGYEARRPVGFPA